MAITRVQKGTANTFANNLVTLEDDPPTEDNVLILQAAARTGFGVVPAGWTTVRTAHLGGLTYGGVFIHTVGAGESQTVDLGVLVSDRNRLLISEWTGISAADISTIIENQLGTTDASIGPITPTAGVPALLYSATFSELNTGAGAFTAGDLTELDAGDSDGFGPSGYAQYDIIATTSGGYDATVTIVDPFHENAWAAILVVFSGEAPEPPPDPEPGFFTEAGTELPGLISVSVQRGASAEITGGATVGTATFVVKNDDNQYDPENAGSPLYPQLRDGLGVWQGFNNDGHLTGSNPRGVFAGRIKDITLIPSPGASEPATAEIVCEDPLGWYGRTPVNVLSTEGRSQANLRTAALQAAGETRYDLAHEITTMPLAGAEGNLLSVLEDINKANGTRHFVKPANNFTDWYSYVTRNRQWRLDGTVDASITSTDHDDLSGWRFSADTVTNQQKATVTPIRFTPNTVEVWKLKQRSLSITGRRVFDTWIDFDDYVRDIHVDAHWTGNTPTIVLTPYGNRAHLRISNTSVGHSTTFSTLTIEGSIARRLPQESYVANDTDSQALPRGIRAGSDISNDYVGTLESATGIAQHVVWRYSDVQLRPTVTVYNWFPDMFDIDLYDTIAFTSTHLGVADRLFEVVGVTHFCDLASAGPVLHKRDYVLQECRVQSDPGWFYLDDSLLDGDAILAY